MFSVACVCQPVCPLGGSHVTITHNPLDFTVQEPLLPLPPLSSPFPSPLPSPPLPHTWHLGDHPDMGPHAHLKTPSPIWDLKDLSLS